MCLTNEQRIEIILMVGSESSCMVARKSPDLSPLGFLCLGHLKAMVYQVKIRDINHLNISPTPLQA